MWRDLIFNFFCCTWNLDSRCCRQILLLRYFFIFFFFSTYLKMWIFNPGNFFFFFNDDVLTSGHYYEAAYLSCLCSLKSPSFNWSVAGLPKDWRKKKKKSDVFCFLFLLKKLLAIVLDNQTLTNMDIPLKYYVAVTSVLMNISQITITIKA